MSPSAEHSFRPNTPTNLAEPGLPPLTGGLTAAAPGISAHPLRLPDLDEETTDLTDFRGIVLVVNFWATWYPAASAKCHF